MVTGLSVIAGPLSGASQYLSHITQILASINDQFCATSDDDVQSTCFDGLCLKYIWKLQKLFV